MRAPSLSLINCWRKGSILALFRALCNPFKKLKLREYKWKTRGRGDAAQQFYHGAERLLPVRPLPGVDAPLQLGNKVIFFCVDRGLHHSGKEDRSGYLVMVLLTLSLLHCSVNIKWFYTSRNPTDSWVAPTCSLYRQDKSVSLVERNLHFLTNQWIILFNHCTIYKSHNTEKCRGVILSPEKGLLLPRQTARETYICKEKYTHL